MGGWLVLPLPLYPTYEHKLDFLFDIQGLVSDYRAAEIDDYNSVFRSDCYWNRTVIIRMSCVIQMLTLRQTVGIYSNSVVILNDVMFLLMLDADVKYIAIICFGVI